MTELISCKKLVFKEFIHYPDINIKKNEVTFISGESGCGKSTFLKLLNGTISPSSGDIFYNGIDISDIDKLKLRREIVLTKQVPFLFNDSIYENFLAFHNFRESTCPSKDLISNYLELCCIPINLDSKCDSMSGGERQRIFLSIALSFMPKVLLLDEPTSALNKDLSNRVLENIISYGKSQNISMIIISHDDELKNNFSENIIRLESSNG